MSTDSCYSYVSCDFGGKDKHGKINFKPDTQLTKYKESCSIIPKNLKWSISMARDGITRSEGLFAYRNSNPLQM